MPITHHIIEKYNLIVSKHIGVISDKDLLASHEQLYQDPAFNKSFHKLVDLRLSVGSVRSRDAVSAGAALVKRYYADSLVGPKTAIVASEDVSFGLSRMYGAFAYDIPGEIMVFRDVDEAIEWLAVPAKALDDIDEQK